MSDTLSKKKEQKLQVWVSLFAITKPGMPLSTQCINGRLTSQLVKLDRTGNFPDMFTHMPPFLDGTGQCSASSHGIHSTSEAGQLYSYCILNYQDSGFYGTLVFLRDLSVLFAKKNEKNSKHYLVYIWIKTFQRV